MLLALLALGCEGDIAPAPVPGPSPSRDTSASPPELQQLQAIRSGEADTILLTNTPISAHTLDELPTLDGRLKALLLDAGGIDDQGMSKLAKIKSLVHLRIRKSDISDKGIEQLVAGDLPDLRILNIPHCRITAQGVALMHRLPQLVLLRLGGPQIDDSAVAAMTKLPKLSSLHLIGPSLSQRALQSIGQCEELSSFYLDDCPLPDAAWETLFRQKPNLHVHVDQQHHDRDPHAQPH